MRLFSWIVFLKLFENPKTTPLVTVTQIFKQDLMESVADTEVESEVESEEELAEVTVAVAVAESLPVTAPQENPDLTKQQIPTQTFHNVPLYFLQDHRWNKTLNELKTINYITECSQCLWKHSITSLTNEERQWHTWISQKTTEALRWLGYF